MGGLCSCWEALAFTKRSASVDLHLKRPRPYRDYITWLQQDISSLRDSGSSLAVYVHRLLLDRPPDSLVSQEESYAEQQIQLSAAATAALQSLARQHQLTLNTWCRASGLCF